MKQKAHSLRLVRLTFSLKENKGENENYTLKSKTKGKSQENI